MDQRSFEEGLKLGMRVACVAIDRGIGYGHANAAKAPVEAELKRVEAMIERRRSCKREMIARDIFLERPMMTAADIGLTA